MYPNCNINNPYNTNSVFQQQPLAGMEFPGNPGAINLNPTPSFGNYSVQMGNGQPLAYPTNPCATYNPMEFPGAFNPYHTYNPQASVIPGGNVPYNPFMTMQQTHQIPVQTNPFGDFPYNVPYTYPTVPTTYMSQNNPFIAGAEAYQPHVESLTPSAPTFTDTTAENVIEEESNTYKEFNTYNQELENSLAVYRNEVTDINQKIKIIEDSISMTQGANHEFDVAVKLSALHTDLEVARKNVEDLENQISSNDVEFLTYKLNRI